MSPPASGSARRASGGAAGSGSQVDAVGVSDGEHAEAACEPAHATTHDPTAFANRNAVAPVATLPVGTSPVDTPPAQRCTDDPAPRDRFDAASAHLPTRESRPDAEPPAPAGPSARGAGWTSSRALRGLFGLASIYFVKEAQPLLAPIVFAVVLTFVLAPFVRALRRRGVPEVLGAAVLVVALLGSVGLLAASVAGPAELWWQRAPSTVARLIAQVDRLRAAIPGLGAPAAAGTPLPSTPAPSASRPPAAAAGPAAASPTVPAAPPAADPLKDRLASEGVALTGLLLGRSASFAMAAAATVILLYFLLASEHWMLSRCVEAVPRRRTRALVLGGIRAAQRDIGRYLLALVILNGGAGLATGLAVHALGLPNPTLWGALTAVLCFVPYIGPLVIVAALLSAGVASFTDEVAMLAPAAAFLVVHAIETNLLSPWVVGRRLALSPVSVFLSVMLWGWMWGIAGALVAVPILIGLRCVCRRNRRLRLLSLFLDGDHRRPPPSLRSLLRARRRTPPHAGPPHAGQ